MGKKIPRITNSEMQILEVLWDEGEALTSSEIVEVSDDRTWKSSSVHLLLNSLLKKNLVQVAGFKKTTKNYARTFEPSMSREEYSLNQLQQEKKKNTKVFSKLFNTFISEEVSSTTLRELSGLIDSRLDQLDDEE